MSEWIDDALIDLDCWITQGERDHQSIQRIIDGLIISSSHENGEYANGQRPNLYIPGLTARKWWNQGEFSWVEPLRAVWWRIVQELNQNNGILPAKTKNRFVDRGQWSVLYLSCIARPDRASIAAFPETWDILRTIPGATTAGMAYFSKLVGGTHIRPHTGFTNAHLRCHLALTPCNGCRIRVGDEYREWSLGDVLLFDDSFDHEVWNASDRSRLVLLFDFFHPELQEAEIEALRVVLQCFRKHFMRTFWSKLAR